MNKNTNILEWFKNEIFYMKLYTNICIMYKIDKYLLYEII